MSEGHVALIKNNKHLRDTAFNLRNLFSTGYLDPGQILEECARMDESLRIELFAASKKITNNGLSFAQAVTPIFAERELQAIVAGEASGKLLAVFDQIWKAAKIQEEINKVLRGLINPLLMMLAGVLVALGFFVFLIPSVFNSLASGAPMGYEPGYAIRASLATREWLELHYEWVLLGLIVVTAVFFTYFSKSANRAKLSTRILTRLIKFDIVGLPYAHLQFGLAAKYLEIVSMAGLDMQVRIRLVVQLLPDALRPGLRLFLRDFETKGMKEAARSENRPVDDPRSSKVFWPTYWRLAFSQAHETGLMEEPMRENGNVMILDGTEKLQGLIKWLYAIALICNGVLILIPVSLLYGTMGEILIMRMRQL